MTARRSLWALIAASALLRLGLAAGLGPGNDEAYHYLMAIHPDWSYYDHPPMMALVESVGLATAGFRAEVVPLRLGFIALFAGSTWLLARLTSRFYGERAGLIAAFALNVSAYYGAAAGTFALPDGPLLFFWLLTLDRLASAFERPESIARWAGVGLAWGGALLSKYHGIFLPIGALAYILLEPSARTALKKPGPYIAALLGVLAFSPVIYWNATHGWASFAFQGSRAIGGGLRFRPDALLGAIAGQVFYLLPWVWLALVVSLGRAVRNWWTDGASGRFLICQAAVPLFAFLGVASTRPVLPHWSLIGLLPAYCFLGRDWSALFAIKPALIRRRLAAMACVVIVLGAAIVLQARTGIAQKVLAAKSDPTVDLMGWDQVARALEKKGLIGRPETFFFTNRWYQSGQLAFATDGKAPVLCYNAREPHNFALWSMPEEWVGRDGILLIVNPTWDEAPAYERWFESVEPIDTIEVSRPGGPVRRIEVYRCHRQTRPFPFAPAPALAASKGDGTRLRR